MFKFKTIEYVWYSDVDNEIVFFDQSWHSQLINFQKLYSSYLHMSYLGEL